MKTLSYTIKQHIHNPLLSFKFYFERFPAELLYRTEKGVQLFKKHGKVISLFVSKRKMKLGRRFGFVTLQSHQLQDILKERLNLIWFNTYKQRANMVRFSKPSINLSMGKQEALAKKIQTWTRLRDGRNYVDVVKTPECGKTLEARTMIHETKDEDVEWLHISLVCVIAFDVDYTPLKTKLMQSGLGMIGLKFLGAKQVILTFNTYDSMIEATKSEAVEWEIVFTEIRPWLRADRAIDRFTLVSISGLHLAAWNKDCITNILAAQGKVSGYDLSRVGHSYISGVHVLIATPSTDSLHDRTQLTLDGEQFQISVAEIGQPSCPKLSSIQDHSLESGSEDEDFRDVHSVTKRGFWV